MEELNRLWVVVLDPWLQYPPQRRISKHLRAELFQAWHPCRSLDLARTKGPILWISHERNIRASSRRHGGCHWSPSTPSGQILCTVAHLPCTTATIRDAAPCDGSGCLAALDASPIPPPWMCETLRRSSGQSFPGNLDEPPCCFGRQASI